MINTFLHDDKLGEECGVFGIYNHKDAAALTALGLHALQHRGQEACGIVSFDGEEFHVHKSLGLVGSVFSKSHIIDSLKGHVAIGHNRYSTTGEPSVRNVQPLYGDMDFGGFAVSHNGNLTNAMKLRQNLVSKGAIFQSTSDSEVIVHLVANATGKTVKDRIIRAVSCIIGGFALIMNTENKLYAVRDPHGIRPLCLGRLGDSYVLASESCAFDIIGADFIREVEPGELIIIDQDGVHSSHPFEKKHPRPCIFEYVYFARPDSTMGGRSIYEIRKNIGIELAKESPAPDADVVVPVPDSGTPSALGYAYKSGLPFELGIIRNHYVGRTFIEPTDQIRHLGVKLKHSANRKFIEGKSVVLVDDSIVRGTTSRKIVEMVRQAGAKKIHMRIASPPVKFSSFYGIDTPTQEELLANTKSVEEIRDHIGADSLAYVSIDGLYRALGEEGYDPKAPKYEDACFTGDYPVELVDVNANSITNKITQFKTRDS